MSISATSLGSAVFLLLIMAAPLGIVAHLLAKEKGRKVTLWTVLGIIPVVNYFCVAFFVGAANLRMERKLDQCLNLLDSIGTIRDRP